MTHQSDPGGHPDPALLERFMRNEAEPAERRRVVRHLIAGCPRCLAVTSSLWALADPPAGPYDASGGDAERGARADPTALAELAEIVELSAYGRIAGTAGIAGTVGTAGTTEADEADEAVGADEISAIGALDGLSRRGDAVARAQAFETAAPGAPAAPAALAVNSEGAEEPRAFRRRRRTRDPGARRSWSAPGTLDSERLAAAGRRIEREREQAPRLAAELLASAARESPAPARTSLYPQAPPAPLAHLAPPAPPTPAASLTVPTPSAPPTPPAPMASVAPTSPDITAAVLARPDCLTPAVCEALLDRSREAAAEPTLALAAAELALVIAERLDPGVCGPTIADGLRVRAWAHLAQARRLGDDLEGAEWALAMAEALARDMAGLAGTAAASLGTGVKSIDPGVKGAGGAGSLDPGVKSLDPGVQGAGGAVPAAPAAHGGPATTSAANPPGPERANPSGIETSAGTLPFVPAEWAELLVFKAGVFADRGDLGGADRLLGRAAELFHAGAEPQRAGRALVQQGLIRADLGDRERAAELLRAGIDLLDPAAEPGLVAANLYRLAALLRGIAMAGGHALPAVRALEEALRLVRRSRTLYRALGDAAAEAHLTRLQGQVEAALGRLDDAAATLLAATGALAEHGFGREAALAQIELALVLLQQGRAADVRRLGLDRWPLLQARDKSWEWVSAVLVFQVLAAREPAHPGSAKLLGELARYLAPRPPRVPPQPHDPRHRRLERIA